MTVRMEYLLQFFVQLSSIIRLRVKFGKYIAVKGAGPVPNHLRKLEDRHSHVEERPDVIDQMGNYNLCCDLASLPFWPAPAHAEMQKTSVLNVQPLDPGCIFQSDSL